MSDTPPEPCFLRSLFVKVNWVVIAGDFRELANKLIGHQPLG